MKIKHYLPVILIVVIFGVLIGVNSFLTRHLEPDSPELYQSQAGDVGNSLKDITKFELEIELKKGNEIRMDYWTDQQGTPMAIVHRSDRPANEGTVSDEKAKEEIQTLIASLPPLTAKEPLTLIQPVLDQLAIHQADIKDFELEYELTDGTHSKIELEIDDYDDMQQPAEKNK